jgi:serine/threonine protein kinase
LILDFGLARALDEGSRNHSSSNPNLLGTFGYIAPEQLQGKPHSIASDIYSFGIVWFEMLTGELPFEFSASSAVEAALARLQGSAVAPSSKNPLVPADLDAVVLGCLRRSPKDRYRTASEVLAALDALENRARSPFQKRKLVPLTVAAVIGAVAAYVAVIPSNRKPVAEATIHAAAPAAVALGETTQPPPAPSVVERSLEPASSSEQSQPAKLPRAIRTVQAARAPARRLPEAAPELGENPHSPADVPPPPSAPRVPPRLPPVWENPFDAGTPSVAAPVAAGGS